MNKNNQLVFEGFSKNLRYIFTNKGIYDFKSDKALRYESLSIIDGINILQEVQDFEYKMGKITLQEHTSNPRKAMIAMTNIFSPENSVTILKEWENRFGNKLLMLNESVDSLIIESRINEAWDGVRKVMINELLDWLADKAKGVYDWGAEKVTAAKDWVVDKGQKVAKAYKEGGGGLSGVLNVAGKTAGYVGDKIKQGFQWIKDKAMAAWKCLTSDFIGCLMEGLRSAMYSMVGMAVEAFLTVTGVGAPVVVVLYGLMTVWDIYLLATGDERFSWANLFCSVLGVFTSGVAAPVLRNLLKGAGLLKSGGTLKGLLGSMMKGGGKLAGYVKQFAGFLGKGASKALGFLKQGTDWLAKNFGIEWLSKYIGKAQTWLDDIGKAAVEASGGAAKTTSTATKTAATSSKTASNVAKTPKNYEKVWSHGSAKSELGAAKQGLKDTGTLTSTGLQFGQDVAQTELVGAVAEPAMSKVTQAYNKLMGKSSSQVATPQVAVSTIKPELKSELDAIAMSSFT